MRSAAGGGRGAGSARVLRSIVDFRQDAESQWVAELGCGHARHVRHEPPFSERAWTRTPEGRAARLGSALECARCDARELPDGWREYRRSNGDRCFSGAAGQRQRDRDLHIDERIHDSVTTNFKTPTPNEHSKIQLQ